MEYYRTNAALTRLQQQITTDIFGRQQQLWWRRSCNEHWQRQVQQRKGQRKREIRQQHMIQRKGVSARKRLRRILRIQQGQGKAPTLANKRQRSRQRKLRKGQRSNDRKRKHPTTGCYRCGQQGHLARDCRVAVCNVSETRQEQPQDATTQWYTQSNTHETTSGATTKHPAIPVWQHTNHHHHNWHCHQRQRQHQLCTLSQQWTSQ